MYKSWKTEPQTSPNKNSQHKDGSRRHSEQFLIIKISFFILYYLPGSLSLNGLHNVPFVVNGRVIVRCLISNITFSLVVFFSEKRLIFTNILEAPLSQTPPPDIFRVSRPVNSSKSKACILEINAILSQVGFWKPCLIWWTYAGFLVFLGF